MHSQANELTLRDNVYTAQVSCELGHYAYTVHALGEDIAYDTVAGWVERMLGAEGLDEADGAYPEYEINVMLVTYYLYVEDWQTVAEEWAHQDHYRLTDESGKVYGFSLQPFNSFLEGRRYGVEMFNKLHTAEVI